MSRSTTNWLFVGVMTIVGIFLAHPSAWLSKPTIDPYVDIAGLFISLCGLSLRVVSRHWKIEHGDGKLVTTGPYGVVRHPLYVGSFLAGLGLCLILGSGWFLLVFLVGYPIVHLRVARKEERILTGEWPEEYSAYMNSVPGWLPSPMRVISLIRQCAHCITRRSVLRERSAICGILAGASLLEAWADYVVRGWADARVEVIVWLSVAAILCILLLALRRAPKYGCKTG